LEKISGAAGYPESVAGVEHRATGSSQLILERREVALLGERNSMQTDRRIVDGDEVQPLSTGRRDDSGRCSAAFASVPDYGMDSMICFVSIAAC
jgi:hypothetical protein